MFRFGVFRHELLFMRSCLELMFSDRVWRSCLELAFGDVVFGDVVFEDAVFEDRVQR